MSDPPAPPAPAVTPPRPGPSPERELGRVSVAARPEYLDPALRFVRDLAGQAGLGEVEVAALGEAVRAVCANVIAHGFEPGETGTLQVALARRPGAVAVAVEDRGLPFDFRPLAGEDGSPLGALADKGVVDAVRFASLGSRGNRVEIVKRLPFQPAPTADVPTPAAPAVLAPRDIPLRLRPMTAADAVGVAQCTYRTYGYTCPDEKLYVPDRLRELLAGGLYHAFVAVTDDEEVVGYIDLELDRAGAAVGNAGEAMVDPRFRGHGLFERMRTDLNRHAGDLGLFGIYAEAVTVHPFTQKAELTLGSSEVGMQLADEASRVLFKGMAAPPSPGRTTTVLFYHRTNEGPLRVVHPPAQHAEVIRRIYAHGRFPRELRAAEGPPALPAAARVRVDVSPEWSEALLLVTDYGADLVEQVERRLRELCRRRIDWIGLDLPLASPAAAHVCEPLEALGFFFAGVIPELLDGDVLRLQYLNNVEPDLASAQIASDFGQELLRYVVSRRRA